VDVSVVNGLSATVRLGEVETLEHNKDRGVGITVYFGERKGSASTSDWRPQALIDVVGAACDIARYTAEDSYSGLAAKDLMAFDYPDLDLSHPWSVSVEEAIALATRCAAAARGFVARICNSEGATVSTHEGMRAYGNSHGFVGSYCSTRHSVSCAVIAQSGEAMQRDHWYTTARDAKRLDDVEAVGRTAAQRTVRRLDGRRLPTGTVPVLYTPEVASGLLSHFIGAIRGDSLYRRSTFLLDSLGTLVFPKFVTLREEPHLRGALGSAPFDSEGVRTQARDIVADGVVQGYVLDSYSARKLSLATTGNAGGVHNLSINTGNSDYDGLVRQMHRGLIITELMGQGINKVTGDYSRGAAGFWVEHGAIAYPVEEITVAGNLRDMYADIVAVGNDVDTRRSIRTGSILIARMTVAGT
jgi:PmbA protein